MRRLACLGLLACGFSGTAVATPKSMTVQEMVDIAVTVPGFSYWWGGSKWSPGATDKGVCTPTATGGCPNCTHSGAWGADCSGFVGKAWQIDKPMALDAEYHPYSTQNFVNDTTWWTAVSRDTTVRGDGVTYYKNGAGHIFLYEKGDPWGSMWAWECKGCAYGCTYNLRTASTDYVTRRRKLITATNTCTAQCQGTVAVAASCASVDCAKTAGTCVSDDLGVRCVSALCPAKGTVEICAPDAKMATCADGVLGSLPGTPCGSAGADAGSTDATDAGATAGADATAPDSAATAADSQGAKGDAEAGSTLTAPDVGATTHGPNGGGAAASGCTAARAAPGWDARVWAAIGCAAWAIRRRRSGPAGCASSEARRSWRT